MDKKDLRRLIDRIPPFVPTAVCLAVICWLTLVPRPFGDNDLPLFPGADKLVHAFMFGGLALCLTIDLGRRRKSPDMRNRQPPTVSRGLCLTAALCSALTGWGIELLQRAMHLGRSYEPADLLADAIGALLFPFLWRYLRI